MSTFCIVLVLFAAQPAELTNADVQSGTVISSASASAADQLASPPLRKGKELEEATHSALRRWAKVDKANAPSAARDFIAIFNELKEDASMARSTRRELGGQVRNRLAHLAEVIQKNSVAGGKSQSPPNLGNAADGPNILGQLGGGMNPPGAAGVQGRRGQSGAFGGNPPGGAPQDAGEELVGLIQKTIAPSSWDINGGPGTIRYWRPGHALVVRASEDVQEQIGGVLGQLH